MRDLLFHFDAERVQHVLQRIEASGSRYLLTTSFPAATRNDVTKFRPGLGFSSFAGWNLQAPPFNLSEPLLAIGADGRSGAHRIMGLWRLPLERADDPQPRPRAPP